MKYKPGITNCVIDALSRGPTEWEDKDDTATSTFLTMIFSPLFHLVDQFKDANISDPFLQTDSE